MQRTITEPLSFHGKGMHSGINSIIRCFPAKANTGIVFKRLDSHGKDPFVTPDVDSIVQYPACTCIENKEGVSVRTVEHLMAACYAMGIDNLLVEIEGDEIPILDGSAEPIVRLIEAAGVTMVNKARKQIQIDQVIHFEDEHRRYSFEPSEEFEVDINIYPQEYGHMRWAGEMTPELFRNEIVQARAWGRLKDIWLPKLIGRFLKKPVLGGAGLGTAVVYAFGKPVNPQSLKNPDDMVRHKVLDIIGDLQLLRADLKGKITCHSSAHATNHSAMRMLLDNKQAWHFIE